jgi:hypothetical protein
MENQNQNNQINEINKPKSKFWKFALGFAGIIIGIFILYVAGLWGWRKYEWNQSIKRGEIAEENLKKLMHEQAMADTYGGKTPQETLQMYIDAVEKGDYELASKYFIGGNQEKELNSFNGATEKFIKEYLFLLNEAIKNSGGYSWDEKYFSIDKPIGVRMKIYPNSIWKIIEI